MASDIESREDIYRNPVTGRIFMAVGNQTVRLTRGFIPRVESIIVALQDGRTEGYGWELI